MHSDPVFERSDYTDAHRTFLRWVQSFLDKDKYETFEKLFLCPLPTNNIVETIFNGYHKIYFARNKYIRNVFATNEIEVAFNEYLASIGFDDFWNTESMEVLKAMLNGYLVIDLKTDQVTLRPQPYMFVLSIECVWDVEQNQDGSVEYIIFTQPVTFEEQQANITDKMAVMDDQFIYIYTKQKSTMVWVQTIASRHGLGYPPAFKFYPKPSSKINPINSKSPITASLGDLDRQLFWSIAVEHYDLYGAFPIYWSYKQRCGYVDEDYNQCENGYISYDVIEEDGTARITKKKQCPRCAAKKALGAGNWIEVEPPQGKEDADLRDPVGLLNVDVDALKHLKEKLKDSGNNIIFNATGRTPGQLIAKAVNELQITSTIEQETTILSKIARTFEKTIFFSYKTMALLMFGNYYKSTTVDLGDDFLLQSVDELNKDYTDIKNAGRPNFELERKREKIYLTTNQNNPEELSRIKILRELEPFQDYAILDLQKLGVDTSDPINYIIKLNFNTFISRFERENMQLEQFAEALTFDSKIKSIIETFKQYADEIKPKDNTGQQINGAPDPGTGITSLPFTFNKAGKQPQN